MCTLLWLEVLSYEIATTDVEMVTACRREGTIYSIQCSYINNSNAQGCIYVLVSMVVGNITGIIKRTSSEGDLVTISNIGYYKEVLAYDWESDNTTGTLPIRGNINSNEMCPITGSLILYAPLFVIIVLHFRSPLY